MELKIGNKIKALRKARGITQDQLAKSLGISFQSVSKWENNIALPDITLAPALATYFGVTMDELFDYDAETIHEKAFAIAKKSWAFRESDPEEGKRILLDGLKQYPENDILLENLLYLINAKEAPDEMIDVALRTLSATKDPAAKYDALRFLAYAYKAKGDPDSAKAAIDQIPELYFTHLSEAAYILSGEDKRIAAEKQRGVSVGILVEMQTRIAEVLIEKGEIDGAKAEYERALKLLDLFEVHDGWDAERSLLEEKIRELN